MIQLSQDEGQILDIFSLILFFVILFSQYKEIRNYKNFFIALISIPIINYCDLFYNSSSIPLLCFIYLSFFKISSTNFIKKANYFIETMILNLLCVNASGSLSILIFKYMKKNIYSFNPEFIIINIILCSFLVLVFLLLKKYILQHFTSDIVLEWPSLLSIFTIGSLLLSLIFILQTIRIFRQNIHILTYMLILFIILTFIIFIITIYFIIKHILMINRTNNKKREEDNYKYIKDLENNINNFNKYKHDLKNIFISLYSLADNGDIIQIKQALKKIIHIPKNNNKIDKQNISLIFDQAVKGLILHKLIIAEQQNISVNLEVIRPIKEIKKQKMIVIRLLGIILDNSLESAYTSKSKDIQIALVQNKSSLEIIVKNSIDIGNKIDINKIMKFGYTTKPQNDGIGLANIRDASYKYKNIYYNIKLYKNYFQIVLTFIGIN